MELKVGQKVLCNGYEGRITKICDGQLEGMVEVRFPRGGVCVDIKSVTVIQEEKCSR